MACVDLVKAGVVARRFQTAEAYPGRQQQRSHHLLSMVRARSWVRGSGELSLASGRSPVTMAQSPSVQEMAVCQGLKIGFSSRRPLLTTFLQVNPTFPRKAIGQPRTTLHVRHVVNQELTCGND